MRVILLLVTMMLVVGCSSPTLQPPKYYVLSGTPMQLIPHKVQHPAVEVRSVALSDYLQSANIVLQVSDHELFFSANHLWAEPLQVGIEKVLSNRLSQTQSLSDVPALLLDVNIDYFHIVDRDAVILSGNYVVESQTGANLVRERFTLREPLNHSGYEYAVSVMSSILGALSQEIAAKVTAQQSSAR
ncbi:hypothetical protein MAQ5080_02258 [Marinomonas aquimarina]|uniref:ABC-type transport auxiliary lipoprotein component domain-containing protein n=1 Tax=Marinomonas aquimarina TaxID=295068 RepID=A0A1A8TGT5_9GAMM|nr:PqiC family protein [Marinomonas aquimarina]SBS32418.1 hypothetical protein MAQ5080_02258 [Marinomonas aquimarina]